MNRLFALILTIIVSFSAHAESDNDSINQKKTTKFQKAIYDHMSAYGSYRINFGITDKGYIGMADNSSRFGIKGLLPLTKTINAIAGIELGAKLVEQDEKLVFRGDPGYQVGDANTTLFGRLGFVGFEHKYFSFTIGKQWSAYYDVASYTDMLWAFGGSGSATFNNSTDGGVSGTGRANQLFLLRSGFKNIKIALQVQARNISETNIQFTDTYGGSIQYISNIGLKAGFAYVIVNDGVDHPLPYQAKTGDKSFVGSIAYSNENWYFALLYSKYFQHETIKINDSTTFFYDGYGTEAFASYSFGNKKKWRVALAMNMLWPEKGQTINKYRFMYFVAEYAYIFAKESQVFVTTRQSFKTNILGNTKKELVFAIGLRFSFGY